MNTETTYLTSISGGKDSTAAALHLRELGHAQRFVTFDTGWEHQDTYGQIDYLETVLGPIERATCVVDLPPEKVALAEYVEECLFGRPSPFVRICLKKGIMPRRTVRFCTQELKVCMRWGMCEQRKAVTNG